MSTIRCTYDAEPAFPATDQHPDALRWQVAGLWVDAIGGEPTQAEIDAHLGTDAAGLAKQQRIATDESERGDCKLDAAIMTLVNQTRAEWQTWAGANFPSLSAAEKNRLGTLFWVVSIGVRRMVRNG